MALVISPSPWQEGVMNVPPALNLCLFGGRGAGRTTSALFMSVNHCEAYGANAHVLFVRQTLRSLREVEDTFQLMLGTAYGNKLRVNRQEHVFTLPLGATIEFSPLNDIDDMAKLQGRSFSKIVVDEYGNFSPQQMKFVDQLRANLRAGLDVPTRMVLLANPGGRGHGIIKSRFIDAFSIRAGSVGPWRPHVLDDGKTWVWCPGNYNNNPNLPTNYHEDLFAAAGKDKELFRAWAEGEWNIARGAMFADCLDEEIHRFKARDIPWLLDTQQHRRENGIPILAPPGNRDANLYGYIGADWGQSSPAVAFAAWRLLAARGPYPKGSILLTDEVSSADPDDLSSGMNWSIGRFAEAMTTMAERNGVFQSGIIDDAKGLQPDDTLITGLEQYGFNFQRPQKNRRSGWAAMREMLVNAKEKNGKPGLWVADRCTGFWSTVPTAPRDPNNQEDLDSRSIDHWADASRYVVTHEPQIVGFNSQSETLKRYGIGAPTAPRVM